MSAYSWLSSLGLSLEFSSRKGSRHQTIDKQHGANAEKKDTNAAPSYLAGEQMHEQLSEPEPYYSRHELPGVAHQ